MNELIQIRDALRLFAAEREWAAFHSPKNLAAALSVEAGELLEHFQWLTSEESRDIDADAVSLEMADVFIYLIQLADSMNVDLAAAARKKIGINANKYPVRQRDLF